MKNLVQITKPHPIEPAKKNSFMGCSGLKHEKPQKNLNLIKHLYHIAIFNSFCHGLIGSNYARVFG
jgi:hypothetical protein